MRNIINISVPAEMKKEIDVLVKEGNYVSVSEFFRDMLREWKRQRLFEDLKQSEKDYRNGKYKVFKSFREMR